MSRSRQLFANIISSLIVMILSLIISFFLTPFIVSNMGTEAYGFFKLAYQISGYIMLFFMLINTMTARFFTIELHQSGKLSLSRYYSSNFMSNVFLTAVLLLPVILFIFRFEYFITVPSELVDDVRILFALVMIQLLTNITFFSFGTVFYVQNKLYINSLFKIGFSVFEAIALLLLYSFLPHRVFYYGIVLVMVAFMQVLVNRHFKRMWFPWLKVERRLFDFSIIRKLLAAGFWNFVSRLSMILLDGLDLLFANIFISAEAMGIVAVSKTIPSQVSNLIATIVQAFSPYFTALFAEGKKEELSQAVLSGMRIISFCVITPISGFLFFSKQFYSLWMPGQDPVLLSILSSIVLVSICLAGITNILKNVFVTLNRIKIPAIVMLISGLISTIIVLILLNTTDLGIWAIVGISPIIAIIRELSFTPYYARKLLGFKRRKIFIQILRGVALIGVNLFVFLILNSIMGPIRTWGDLIIQAIPSGMAGYIGSFYVILNPHDRKRILVFIQHKLHGGK